MRGEIKSSIIKQNLMTDKYTDGFILTGMMKHITVDMKSKV